MTTFDDAFKYTVYGWEGGAKCSNDPLDPGGVTKYGISKKYNPTVDVAHLDEAGAKAIYDHNYWDAMQGDKLTNPKIAIKLFDACVNPGPGVALKFAQQAAGATPDGHIGPNSIKALNTVDTVKWLTTFCILLAGWYNAKPDSALKRQDIHGWLRRANSIPH